MSENKDNQQQPKRQYTQREIEQMRQRRDIAIKKRAQAIREAKTSEEREQLFIKQDEVSSQRKKYQKPTTLKGKIEHFWYYNKYITLWALVILVVISVGVYDVLSREKYDLTIEMYTNNFLEIDEVDETEKKIEGVITDIDGKDGENVLLQSIQLQVNNKENLSDQNSYIAAQLQFTTSISEVNTFIYILDQAVYQTLVADEVEFVDLSTLSDNPDIEGEKFYLKNSKLFADMPRSEEAFLVVRDISTASSKDKKSTQEKYEYECQMASNILNYK